MWRSSRARLDRVATRQRRKNTADGFIDFGLNTAALGLRVGDEIEDRAIFDTATVAGALVDSRLKMSFVPTHEKITMTTVASLVADGPDKRLAVSVPFIGKLASVPDDLEEERDQVDREFWRAFAIVV